MYMLKVYSIIKCSLNIVCQLSVDHQFCVYVKGLLDYYIT
jgi:hypothetical protein